MKRMTGCRISGTERVLGVVVCVSIVDAAAYPVAFLRMDGLAPGCIDVCNKKARTAALFHMDSADFALAAVS
ncbi:heme-binding protein [Gluconacetobacter tumulicola]|uniref:Heme-binding protein n=2 Tax=Gluconacetobacter tumulicola TaxID=1017177 RepID=A0A7W4JAM7_9PROT|nr:heme-binding protein [Gluconacetobacter tumulicola]